MSEPIYKYTSEHVEMGLVDAVLTTRSAQGWELVCVQAQHDLGWRVWMLHRRPTKDAP